MGSSFTEYRGAGFWARDASIELWLYVLAQEVRKLDDPHAWLLEAAEGWPIQARVGMGGCVSAGLDQYCATPDRAAIVLQLSERVVAGLRSRGEVLPAEWLNLVGLGGPGATFTRELPTAVFRRVGNAFIQLLRGEIMWDASTSPVL